MASILSQVQCIDAAVIELLGENVRNILFHALAGATVGCITMKFAKSIAIIAGLSVISIQLLHEYDILTIDWSYCLDEVGGPIRKMLESFSLYNIWQEHGFIGGLLIGISIV